jgi:hypothetical protein
MIHGLITGAVSKSARAASRLGRRLSTQDIPKRRIDDKAVEIIKAIRTTIACSTAIAVTYIAGNVIKESILLSKPGSAEEQAALKKVEDTSRAAASGAAKGALEVTGVPNKWLQWGTGWSSAEPPKKS